MEVRSIVSHLMDVSSRNSSGTKPESDEESREPDLSCTCGETLFARIQLASHPTITVGRYASFTCHGYSGATYVEGASFDEVRLCRGSSPVRFNSIVLIPMLLTQPECEGLVADVERVHSKKHDVMTQSVESYTAGASLGFARYSIPVSDGAKMINHASDDMPEMSDATRLLFEDVLRARLLPFISTHMPLVEAMVVARSFVKSPLSGALSSQLLRFSAAEPAVNRYTAGGRFTTHTDKLALTLNCLLSSGFSGGGTEFWCEAADAEEPLAALGANHSVHIQPHTGVGVVFNGSVLHSGTAVATGVRHLLVASFSIAAVGSSEADSQRRS
jgi:hypothetical protein